MPATQAGTRDSGIESQFLGAPVYVTSIHLCHRAMDVKMNFFWQQVLLDVMVCNNRPTNSSTAFPRAC